MLLTIQGRPATKKNRTRIIRNRRTGQLGIIQSAEAIAWERSAITQLALQWGGRPAIATPCTLGATFYLHAMQRGDLTNYLSSLSDALEGAGVVANDRLIVQITARMERNPTPRVTCEVLPLDNV